MKNSKNEKLVLLFWIISVLVIIFNVYVLIQYINKDWSLLTLSGIINIVYLIISCDYKALGILIPLAIGSSIVLHNIWYGICFALILDNAILGTIGLIFQIGLLISTFKNK